MSALSRLTLLAVIACCAPAAHAVGLGSIELRSYLNEPLRADVVLRDVTSERLDSISASIASESTYEELGIARNDYLRNVDASLVLVDGEPVVRLRGNRPLQEPLLELLVVVRDGRQLVQRSYTLFIDPPEFAQQRSEAAPEPGAPSTQADTQPSTTQPSGDTRAAEAAPAPVPAAPAEEPTPAALTATAPAGAEDAAEEPAQRAAQDGAEGGAVQATENPQPAASEVVEAPAPSATEAATETAPASQNAPSTAAQPSAEIPRFFTTEAERQLDPELLAEIGQGPTAASDGVQAAPRQAAAPSSAEGYYPVRRGETLWRVAADTRPPDQGITMQQMMLAIVQANPNAFEAGKASELLAGARLRIPPAATIKSVSPASAQRQMQALLDGDRTTQQAAASAAAATPDDTTTAEKQRPQTTAAPDRAGDDAPSQRVESVQPEAAAEDTEAAAEAAAVDTPAATDDDRAAGETESAAQELAAADGDGKEAEGAAADDGAQANMADTAAPDAQEAPVDEQSGANQPESVEAEAVDSEPSEAPEPTQPAASDAEDTGAANATVSSDASEAPQATGADAPATAGEQDPTPASSSAAASAPGTLLGLPWYLVLVAAGVVLLGVAGILEMRRRAAQRAEAEAEEAPRYANLTGRPAAAAAGEAVADEDAAKSTLDEDGAAAQEGAVAATQAGALGESASDDPLADADFRIAYGMYDDAAERLSDAILRDPENAALRLKLAEVHCAADDKERFLDAADAAARSGLSESEERELADMAARIAPDSRFATAIGARMTAGTVFAEANAPAPAELAGAEEDTEATAESDFDALLNPPDDSAQPSADMDAFSDDPASDGQTRVDAVTEASDASDASDVTDADDELAFGDDMAQAVGEAGEAAAPVLAQPGVEGAAEADDNVLEFDLDNLEFDDGSASAGTPASASASPESSAEDEAHALDFDLDSLDLPDTTPVSAEAAPGADDNALDFDWETAPDPEPSKAGAATEASPAPGVDDEGSAETPDGKDEIATAAGESGEDKADPFGATELDAGDFDLDDFSLEDFDLESEADTASAGTPGAPDEEAPTLELPEPEPESAASGAGNEDAFALDDFEINAGTESETAGEDTGDGVAGQLDLARAYVDMGEGDMARPLLEEILQTGSEVQRQEAQRLLDIAG